MNVYHAGCYEATMSVTPSLLSTITVSPAHSISLPQDWVTPQLSHHHALSSCMQTQKCVHLRRVLQNKNDVSVWLVQEIMTDIILRTLDAFRYSRKTNSSARPELKLGTTHQSVFPHIWKKLCSYMLYRSLMEIKTERIKLWTCAHSQFLKWGNSTIIHLHDAEHHMLHVTLYFEIWCHLVKLWNKCESDAKRQ
jgi:hypothetical protein